MTLMRFLGIAAALCGAFVAALVVSYLLVQIVARARVWGRR